MKWIVIAAMALALLVGIAIVVAGFDLISYQANAQDLSNCKHIRYHMSNPPIPYCVDEDK